jgi:two-component system, NarL family, invasion response regulator UvrY
MIRVLIADDHVIVRKGLTQIVSDTPDVMVVGEAGNGHDVLGFVREHDCDVVLLDIAMPGKDGLDTLKELKIIKPLLPVLVLSMYPEEQYAVRLLKAGASGYLTKESAPEELVAAIRKVSSRGKYISASLGEKLAFLLDSGGGEQLPHEQLSDREFQVMLLIAGGKTASIVAEEMCLSVKTVSTYRARALRKMGMRNNAEFAFYAMKEGLLG